MKTIVDEPNDLISYTVHHMEKQLYAENICSIGIFFLRDTQVCPKLLNVKTMYAPPFFELAILTRYHNQFETSGGPERGH